MTLTRIDCDYYRGVRASIDHSSFSALNPGGKAGTLVLAGSCAAQESISSQVACRLALEHFVEGVIDLDSENDDKPDALNKEKSLQVLEVAFKRANNSVYEFGHKLAAGGRMAATLTGLVIEEQTVAAGRAGVCGAYLFRGGELFPFFEDTALKNGSRNEEYVGMNSTVAVELAAIPLEASDIIVVFDRVLTPEQIASAERMLNSAGTSLDGLSEGLARQLFEDAEQVGFVFSAMVGPDTIYLSEAVG